jgi:hypothetical protein|tara:strand:+ start:645 stop:1649 length:1005 start_codon:yes stop_codon:yes gene_type:complete
MLRKDVIETWKTGERKLKEASIRRYLRALDNIYKDCEKLNDVFDNTDGLYLVRTLIRQIGKKNIKKQKADLGYIMSALTPKGRFYFENERHSQLYMEYLDYYNKVKKKCEEEDKKQLKSKHDTDNWVTIQELENIRHKYYLSIRRLKYKLKTEKLREGYEKEDMELFKKYIVASLYLLIPPGRNEYADMEIISYLDYLKLPKEDTFTKNYLVVKSRNQKFFHIAEYKTCKTYGPQDLKISSKLNSVLNLWLKFKTNSKYLLTNSKGGKLSRNGLSKYLIKVFKATGKNITSTIIRKVYCSEKFGNDTSYMEKDKIAKQMGHSVNMQQKIYTKIN